MIFKEYKGLDLVAAGSEVLERWKKMGAFEKSLELREGAPEFIFFEGPPSANGMPGIHHVMARSIKDIFCRFKTMKGYQVKRKAGWDTHGLPVELGVEKMLGITKEDIGKKISVDDYNAACRKEVMKYTKEWTDLTHKMGYWVDLNDPYITYDNRYIETLWWLLKNLYDQELLYKGYTIQPYSPAAGTGLSSHELNQPGCYRDVKDTTVTANGVGALVKVYAGDSADGKVTINGTVVAKGGADVSSYGADGIHVWAGGDVDLGGALDSHSVVEVSAGEGGGNGNIDISGSVIGRGEQVNRGVTMSGSMIAGSGTIEAAKGIYPDLALQGKANDPATAPFAPADLVVANILGPLLIAFADEIAGYVKKNLVISGILAELYPDVLAAFAARGFREISRKTLGEWTTGLLVR